MGEKPIEPWGTSPEKKAADDEFVRKAHEMERVVDFDETKSDPLQELRNIAETMEQWERLSFIDSTGNRVYVCIDYYGDGYEYDDLENPGKMVTSPGLAKYSTVPLPKTPDPV